MEADFLCEVYIPLPEAVPRHRENVENNVELTAVSRPLCGSTSVVNEDLTVLWLHTNTPFYQCSRRAIGKLNIVLGEEPGLLICL